MTQTAHLTDDRIIQENDPDANRLAEEWLPRTDHNEKDIHIFNVDVTETLLADFLST